MNRIDPNALRAMLLGEKQQSKTKTKMSTPAHSQVATQGVVRASAAIEAERKTHVIGPDDARSDSHKVISLARKVAGKHSALLEKLAQ